MGLRRGPVRWAVKEKPVLPTSKSLLACEESVVVPLAGGLSALPDPVSLPLMAEKGGSHGGSEGREAHVRDHRRGGGGGSGLCDWPAGQGISLWVWGGCRG